MISKDPVVRISNEADLTLTNLKHEALINSNRRVYKNAINSWMITHCSKMEGFKQAYLEWIKSHPLGKSQSHG